MEEIYTFISIAIGYGASSCLSLCGQESVASFSLAGFSYLIFVIFRYIPVSIYQPISLMVTPNICDKYIYVMAFVYYNNCGTSSFGRFPRTTKAQVARYLAFSDTYSIYTLKCHIHLYFNW